MVDESRFRYRRDAGVNDGRTAGAPEGREGVRQAPPGRPQPPAGQDPSPAARPDDPRQDPAVRQAYAARQEQARQDAARLEAARRSEARREQLRQEAMLRANPAARPEPAAPPAPRAGYQPRPAAEAPAAPLRGQPPVARTQPSPRPAAQAPITPAPGTPAGTPARVAPTRTAPASERAPQRGEAPSRPAAPARPAAAGQGGDPLAELARLIGEQDPFADFADLTPESAPPAAQATSASRTPEDEARLAEARLAERQQMRLAARRQALADAASQAAAQAAPAAPQTPVARPSAGVPAPAAPRAPAPRLATPDLSVRPPAADMQRRQPSLAPPPPRAALVPPRSDSEPVDRSATSVRLGYGSLAHQAQVRPADPRQPDPRPAPGAEQRAAPARPQDEDDEFFDAPPPRRPPAAYPEPTAYAQPAPAPRPAPEPAAAYAFSAERRKDDDDYDEYDEAYDPQYAEEGYMPPHAEEVVEGETRRRKGRSALLLVASVLGLIVAGTAGVFAYRMAIHGPSGSASNGPPVIRADTNPSKIAAPPSTNPQDAQQKLIYDRVGGAATGNERMLPREEQPVDVATAAIRTTPPSADPVISSLSTEPKRVRTLTVRSDGSIAPEASAGGSANPALTAYAPGAVPAPPPASAAKSSGPAVSKTGDYVVQVASQRSEADAMGSWRALQSRYPNLLGSYVAAVKKADLGERGIFYRAQVGPFATKDQANELCQALRAQGGDCVVNKN